MMQLFSTKYNTYLGQPKSVHDWVLNFLGHIIFVVTEKSTTLFIILNL